MELIGLEELKELNQIADFIISNEMKYPLDSDLMLYIFEKMSKEPSIRTKNKCIKLQLSTEEILKNVLSFFETIDVEYYNQALDFLLQLKKNKRLKLFYSKKSNLSNIEKEAIKLNALYESSDIYDYVQILIPIGLNETTEESKINMANRATLQESFHIVHEIAHTFDSKASREVLSKTINMDEASYKRVLDEVKDSNRVRNAFSETTAITFENIYVEYLKGKAEPDIIGNTVINRYNNCLLNAEICCDNLSISKIKREKGIIRKEDIEALMREDNEGENIIRQRINRILKYKGNIEVRKRYALAGLFAPTLAEQYKNHGIKVLNQYINSVKNNSVDGIFDSIKILQNEQGYDTLFANMKRQVKTFDDFKEKENEELER